MKDALELIMNLYREVHALRKWFRPEHTIPQSEIDEEARRLIAEHGDRAVKVAENFVQQAQGRRDIQKQYARVLKAVKRTSN